MRFATALGALGLTLVSALARADGGGDVDVRVAVHLPTTAEPDALARAACDAKMSVEHGAIHCASRESPPVLARTEGGELVLEVDLGTDVTLARADEVLDALARRAAELDGNTAHPPTSRAFSPALTTTGIVFGATGFAAIVASYVWLGVLLIKPAKCNAPLSVSVPILGSCLSASDYANTEVLEAAGLATMVLGATLAIIGQSRVRIAPVVSPARSGATAGFAIAF